MCSLRSLLPPEELEFYAKGSREPSKDCEHGGLPSVVHYARLRGLRNCCTALMMKPECFGEVTLIPAQLGGAYFFANARGHP